MVDVGFGGDGASKPIPLVEGRITRNIGTQDIRLARDFIPTQTERTPERKLWIYQYRNSPDKPWNSFYAFSDQVEFLPADYHIMNWYTGSHPESVRIRIDDRVTGSSDPRSQFLRAPCTITVLMLEQYADRRCLFP